MQPWVQHALNLHWKNNFDQSSHIETYIKQADLKGFKTADDNYEGLFVWPFFRSMSNP